MRMVWVDQTDPVLVIHVNGEFQALQGTCSHEYFELDRGFLTAGTLTCALHLSRFDLSDGEPLDPPAELPLAVYATEVARRPGGDRGPGRPAGGQRGGVGLAPQMTGPAWVSAIGSRAGSDRSCRTRAPASTSTPPSGLEWPQRLAQQQGRQDDPDHRLEEHQDPCPRAADRPDGGQEQERGHARGRTPATRRIGHGSSDLNGSSSSWPWPTRTAIGRGTDHGGGQDHDRRGVGGHSRVPAPAHGHEHDLAGGSRDAQRDPERAGRLAAGLADPAEQDERHAAQREGEGNEAGPGHALVAQREVHHHDARRVQVEQHQGEGDRHQPECREHRDVEGDAHDRGGRQRRPPAPREHRGPRRPMNEPFPGP